MIIAFVDNGRLDVFNSETGKIVSGAVSSHFEHQSAEPDRRLDVAIGLLELIAKRVDQMIQAQDTVAAEVAALKSNMVDLHTGISSIQSRLDAAIAAAGAGGSTDASILSDLQGVNTDLKGVITALASSAGVPAAAGSGSSTASAAAAAAPVPADPGSSPQPSTGEPAVPAAPVVFDASNTAPNVPGGRNSSQLPNFDPSHPETA